MTATERSAAALADRLLSNTHPTYTFSFTPFLQQAYQHSLPADRPICKAYTAGHCPLGTRCTERHVANPTSPGSKESTSFNSLVCKHWLRGLCKKGESCEFLHEYNLRKMPECNFFVRNGYCSNGDECLYLHIDPMSKLPPCPHYEKGFCPLGPRCAKRHLRRKMCSYFMAGFCPDGPKCKEGAHPRWPKDLEKPVVRDDSRRPGEGPMKDGRDEDDDRDRERNRDRDRSRDRDGGRHDRGGHRDRGRGRGGWRGRGGHKFRQRH